MLRLPDRLFLPAEGGVSETKTAKRVEVISGLGQLRPVVIDGAGIVFPRLLLIPTHLRYYSFPRDRIFFLGGKRGDQRGGAIEVACVNGQLNQSLCAPHRSHRRVFQDQSSFFQVTQAEPAI